MLAPPRWVDVSNCGRAWKRGSSWAGEQGRGVLLPAAGHAGGVVRQVGAQAGSQGPECSPCLGLSLPGGLGRVLPLSSPLSWRPPPCLHLTTGEFEGGTWGMMSVPCQPYCA